MDDLKEGKCKAENFMDRMIRGLTGKDVASLYNEATEEPKDSIETGKAHFAQWIIDEWTFGWETESPGRGKFETLKLIFLIMEIQWCLLFQIGPIGG